MDKYWLAIRAVVDGIDDAVDRSTGGSGDRRCSAIALIEVVHARGNELARTYIPSS